MAPDPGRSGRFPPNRPPKKQTDNEDVNYILLILVPKILNHNDAIKIYIYVYIYAEDYDLCVG